MKLVPILFVIFSASLSTLCAAGAFSVTPVRLYFEPRDRAVALTLVNESDTAIALQADIHSWTQDGAGVDKLELTEDLIVSPPSLRLAPHSKQVVRLALLMPRDALRQMTYRLVVREVPEVQAANEPGVQLPIALVLNMPVFITPTGAKRDMLCVMNPGAPKDIAVTCENSGNAYAQLRTVELNRAGKSLARFEGGVYLLPGARKTFPLKVEEPDLLATGIADLSVTFDDRKPQSFSVTLP